MANTRDTMGEQACLDALVQDTLTSFEDDAVTRVNNLKNHNALIDVKFPSCVTINGSGMISNANLTTVDILGGGNTFGISCFNSSNKIAHLILRSTSKVSNQSGGATSVAIKCGEGALYVPENLVSSYKSDSYWSDFAIRSISAYPETDFSTIDDSWDDIITACGNGTYSSKYAIGDRKSIEIGGTTYYMQLVGMDVDVLATDGITTVPTSWLLFRKMYISDRQMNDTVTTVGGWAQSGLRSWLSSTLLPLIPSNVRTAIKEVRKYSGLWDTTNDVAIKDDITSDKLWVPSLYEIGGLTTSEESGARYSTTLFPAGTSTASNNKRIKYDSNNVSIYWWLRTVSDATKYRIIGSNGNFNTAVSNSKNVYVAFGFCI